MKWNTNDVSFKRSNYRCLIFKFNNSNKWFIFSAYMTTSCVKSLARKMAIKYNANAVEMKYMYDEDDKITEPENDIVSVLDIHKWDEEKEEYFTIYKFRVHVYKGDEHIKTIEFDENELFE